MAITSVGFQGSISESQEARRWWAAAPPVSRQASSSMAVSPGSGRQVNVSSGQLNVCGVAVSSTASEPVSIPSSSTARINVIACRVTWAGANSKAEFVCIQGPSGGTSYPTLTQNPGVLYEAPVAVVDTAANFSSVSSANITSIAPTGGMGGPLQIGSDKHVSIVPAHDGAIIEATANKTRWQRKNGSTVQLAEDGTQWRFFDPVIRYEGNQSIQAADVNLGNGGVRRGRYKIVDGWVIGDIEIRTGASGSYWGTGSLNIKLPPGVPFDNYFADRWMDAHMYTTAQEPMDWQCQALARGGQSELMLWAPRSAADCRLWRARASDPSSTAAGTGIPYIANNFTIPQVITVQLVYSLGV